jgi:pyrimidine-nucleoside phosphorylase
VAAMLLGAGRATKESRIDLAVGIVLHKKIGDSVEAGEALATLYANSLSYEEAMAKIYESIGIQTEAVRPPALIVGEVK